MLTWVWAPILCFGRGEIRMDGMANNVQFCVVQATASRSQPGERRGKVKSEERRADPLIGTGATTQLRAASNDTPYLSNLITWQHPSTARDLDATTEAPKRDSVANRLRWLDPVSSPLFPPLCALLPTRIGPQTLGA